MEQGRRDRALLQPCHWSQSGAQGRGWHGEHIKQFQRKGKRKEPAEIRREPHEGSEGRSCGRVREALKVNAASPLLPFPCPCPGWGQRGFALSPPALLLPWLSCLLPASCSLVRALGARCSPTIADHHTAPTQSSAVLGADPGVPSLKSWGMEVCCCPLTCAPTCSQQPRHRPPLGHPLTFLVPEQRGPRWMFRASLSSLARLRLVGASLLLIISVPVPEGTG